METHSFCRVSDDSLMFQVIRLCLCDWQEILQAFPWNIHIRKLGKITVFYVVVYSNHCVKSVRIRSFPGPNARKYGPINLWIRILFTEWMCVGYLYSEAVSQICSLKISQKLQESICAGVFSVVPYKIIYCEKFCRFIRMQWEKVRPSNLWNILSILFQQIENKVMKFEFTDILTCIDMPKYRPTKHQFQRSMILVWKRILIWQKSTLTYATFPAYMVGVD